MTASRRRCAAVTFPLPAPGTRSLTAVTALARPSGRALRDHRRQQGQHPQPGLLRQHHPAVFPAQLTQVQGKLAETRYPQFTHVGSLLPKSWRDQDGVNLPARARHASAQHRLGRAQRRSEYAASIQGLPVVRVTEHTPIVQVSNPQALLGALADAIGPQAPRLQGRRQLGHRPLRMQPGPVQLTRTARRCGHPRPAHRARPPPAASAATSARSLRSPPASSTIAGPAATATPKMSVADAGIVPGDESGSLTTR
jgi:hypothetical protein